MKTSVIRHPSELNELATLPVLRKRGVGKIQLSESFQHEDKALLERNLNRYYHACGCSTSAKYLLILDVRVRKLGNSNV